MKTKLFAALALIAILSTALVVPADAKKPLEGEMELQFNRGWSEPQTEVPIWVGTITIDEEEYGMAFFNVGTGKPFVGQPNPDHVIFAGEIWTIYEHLEFGFDENGVLATFEPGNVLLSGPDSGTVTLANNKYRLNGSVEEANGQFSFWLGHTVHMRGVVEFDADGAPRFAPGTFRLN
jgi:hypothetical protein